MALNQSAAKEQTMRVIFREDQERREHEALSEDASFPDESEGRDRSTEPDRLRTRPALLRPSPSAIRPST